MPENSHKGNGFRDLMSANFQAGDPVYDLSTFQQGEIPKAEPMDIENAITYDEKVNQSVRTLIDPDSYPSARDAVACIYELDKAMRKYKADPDTFNKAIFRISANIPGGTDG
jgi:hypothetical protein